MSTYDVPSSFTVEGDWLILELIATQKGCYLSISLQFYAPCLGISLCKYVNKAIRDVIAFMVYLRMPKLLSKKKRKEKKERKEIIYKLKKIWSLWGVFWRKQLSCYLVHQLAPTHIYFPVRILKSHHYSWSKEFDKMNEVLVGKESNSDILKFLCVRSHGANTGE